MKKKPSAFYCGQHDETLEHMVIIENSKQCECVKSFGKPWNNEHDCFRFFRNVQSALAFEIGFNRRNAS